MIMMVDALRSATAQTTPAAKPLVEHSSTMELSSAPANTALSSSTMAAAAIIARPAIGATLALNLISPRLATPATHVVPEANRASNELPLVCEVPTSHTEPISGASPHDAHVTQRGTTDSRVPLRQTIDNTQSPQRTLNTLLKRASRLDELS